MIFGVTGQHQLLTTEEAHYVRRIVKRTLLRNKKNVLVSGCAYGVDSEAVIAVWGLLPFENIICVVPGNCIHNYGLVDRAVENGAQLIKAPTLHTVAKTYLNRDDVVVEQIQTLLGFPRTWTQYRSGTWATINKAKRANRRVRLYPFTNIKERHNDQLSHSN